MIGGDGFAVHFNGMRINKFGKAVDHVNFIVAQSTFIGLMDTVDIGGAAFDQFAPIELIHRGIKTIIRAIQMDCFRDLRGVPHYFFRHTTHVYAGAAQILGFNQRTFLAIHGRTVDGSNTAAATANCEIVIMFSHQGVP